MIALSLFNRVMFLPLLYYECRPEQGSLWSPYTPSSLQSVWHILRHRNYWLDERIKKKKNGEFPLWLSGLRTWLVSTRIQVWSLASLSGFKICVATRCGISHCCGCHIGWQLQIQPLTWEHPYATGVAPKGEKKKRVAKILMKFLWMDEKRNQEWVIQTVGSKCTLHFLLGFP